MRGTLLAKRRNIENFPQNRIADKIPIEKSLHFITTENHVDFYKLFILWSAQ
jgi:hypothetical protein